MNYRNTYFLVQVKSPRTGDHWEPCYDEDGYEIAYFNTAEEAFEHRQYFLDNFQEGDKHLQYEVFQVCERYRMVEAPAA